MNLGKRIAREVFEFFLTALIFTAAHVSGYLQIQTPPENCTV